MVIYKKVVETDGKNTKQRIYKRYDSDKDIGGKNNVSKQHA